MLAETAWAQSDSKTETAPAGDRLTLLRGGKEHVMVGDVLLDAQDNSLYFMQDNGRAWIVKPDEIKQRVDSDLDAPPKVLTRWKHRYWKNFQRDSKSIERNTI